MEKSISDFSSEEYENLQPTTFETNDASINITYDKINYKKWISSESSVSNISSLINSSSDSSSENTTSLKEEKNKDEKNNEKINEKENSNENSELKEIREDLNNVKTNFIFIWDDKGTKVKITGSFCDWKIQFDMTKDPNNNLFQCQLPLDNKKYFFKFIVDDEWLCSNKYVTEEDHSGNINNIIDLSKNIENNNKKIEEIKEIKEESQMNKTENKLKRKESIYSSEYPSNDNIMPLPLPNKRYYQSFQLEKFTRQKNIGKDTFVNFENKNYQSSDTSCKNIYPLGHVYLNHLISSTKNKKKKNVKNCFPFRFREKNCTFLYYK